MSKKKNMEQRLLELEKRQTALEQQFKDGLEGEVSIFQNKDATHTVELQKQHEKTVTSDPLKKWEQECRTLALLLQIPIKVAREHHDTLLEKCKQCGIW